ncbi:hypothetical protein H6G74_19300 [Nostoc spongiaeforme FACHB-130]|uniref:Uncharacterized protein n=1 Tax=Nostoc spongiaeforme FACHB-130 TaxID=1357510 RepID=A0ABR8FYI0_9NOSO|nr:hypothetical protein [Nostoc spongiaeforme]MBD2596461.1 hypothetical protein [Nostoc spongiaeforme FACHB-130]
MGVTNPTSTIISDKEHETFSKCNNNTVNLLTNIATNVVDENPNRIYALFQNNSKFDITLILGDSKGSGLEKGIVLYARGGCFQIDTTNLYIGKVSAISANNCKLSFVECVE